MLNIEVYLIIAKAEECREPMNRSCHLHRHKANLVPGYQLLSEASGMPQEFQYLRVAIKTEESRLLNWAHIARLDEQEENLLIAQANKQLLLDVLEEQRKLLMRFGKLDEKYKPLSRPLIQDVMSLTITGPNDLPPAYSEDGPAQNLKRARLAFQNRFPRSEKLLSKALECVKSTQVYPAGLKWATFDRAAVEQLVHRLKAMNDYMESLLTQQQLNELLERQTRTEFQILQLNDKMDQLLEIVESSTTFSTQSGRIPSNHFQAFLHGRGLLQSSTGHGEQSSQQRLGSLAKTKAFLSAIESNSVNDKLARDLSLDQPLTEIMTVELDRKNIRLSKPEDEMDEIERVEAFYTDPKTKRRQKVWIEWKSYDPQSFNGNPDPMILERLKALTTLLKENKHSDKFRAPHCLGYFRDCDPVTNDDACRFGLVFETPEGISSLKRPISLLSLLQQKKSMPSLTARIALCHALSEIVEKLHAVDWVHKGLRSHNVLFFSDDSYGDPDSDWPEIDFSQPYISGFDYSRPAQNEELTEKPPENAAMDVYRHPSVHGSAAPLPHNSSSYKKSYDIYSLGIILLEIAFWKPIHEVLGIDLASARPTQTIKVRQRLCEEAEWLGYVRGNLGDKVYGVVGACLRGVEAFGLEKGADEREGRVKEELQVMYYDVVVRRLGEVKV
jgi:Prion-inhibition and propagation